MTFFSVKNVVSAIILVLAFIGAAVIHIAYTEWRSEQFG